MLVGTENTPVCESTDIIWYMDNNFKGEVNLQAAFDKDEGVVRQRYNDFLEIYKEWNQELVDGFSLGTI